LVTADHGFIYKREKTVEADKIERFSGEEDMVNKRFVVSEDSYDTVGTTNMTLSEVLGNDDYRVVTTPLTSNHFKYSGGGQNFLHGGTSPQETIVPIVQIKTVRGKIESEDVQISLISRIRTITSLNINLDFFQQDAINESIHPVSYRIAFVDENNQVISNEEIHYADSKEEESARSEEHTSELQSRFDLVCRLLL